MLRTLICLVSLCITTQRSVLAEYFPRNVVKILTVNNGGRWGDWQDPDFCAEETFANGYKMKIESSIGDRDDTSLNAIVLQCKDATRSRYGGQVRSGSGSWGDWWGLSTCASQNGTHDFLTAFSLQVERNEPVYDFDDTAANFVKFMCRDLQATRNQYQLAHAPGQGLYGFYGGWSESCPAFSAICGIQTRIESPQGTGDDTTLNDVRFFCCT